MKRTIHTYTVGQEVLYHTNSSSQVRTIIAVANENATLDNNVQIDRQGDILGGHAPQCDWIEVLTPSQLAEIKG